MTIIISPAKKLTPTNNSLGVETTNSEFPAKLNDLVDYAKSLSKQDLIDKMKISPSLAQLNFDRFQKFQDSPSLNAITQAVYTFKGDTYVGLKAENFTKDDLLFAQKNLLIISGLYGLLKPLDGIQPYRFEMGTKIDLNGHKSLYEFWMNPLSEFIKKRIEIDNNGILNLASEEYSKALNFNKIGCKLVTPVFKTEKNGGLKTVGILSKRARGMMASYVIKNKIKDYAEVNEFSEDGYEYNEDLSTLSRPVFIK
tara:strand:- start:708 stop:1469 length:762 start_codon:yes stop_codon:yes gene_type:complete